MKTWRQLQDEVSEWAHRNFGHSPAWMSVLGVVEELGEFWAAEDNYPVDVRLLRDALGDQAIYALSLCQRTGVNIDDVIIRSQLIASPSTITPKRLLGGLAVISHGVLKHSQGIRGIGEDKQAELVSAGLAVWHAWANWQMSNHGLFMSPHPTTGLLQVVNHVWESVSKRDWRSNPVNGQEVPPQCRAHRPLTDGTIGVAFCSRSEGHEGPHVFFDDDIASPKQGANPA